jgi:hypothetical protein
MNWEAIGAIAELLGAIGVIASLVYLARQIRDGQRALRAGSYQQFRQDISQSYNQGMKDPQTARAIRAGMANFAELDEEDAFRFDFWIHGVMHTYDNAHYQHRMGMLDDERWEMHRSDFVGLFTNDPGVAQWWRQTGGRRSKFSPAFVALVEEILDEEPGRED